MRLVSTELNRYISQDIFWDKFLTNIPNVKEKAQRKSWIICYEAMFHIKMCERIAKEFEIPGLSFINPAIENDPMYVFEQLVNHHDNDVVMVYPLPMCWIEQFHKENGRDWNYYTLDKGSFVKRKHIKDLQHVIELLDDGFFYTKNKYKCVFDDHFRKLPKKLYCMGYFDIVGEKNIFGPDYDQKVRYY